MRQKRAKTYKKLLANYIRTFGLRPPLQILIDSQMAISMAEMKLRPEEVYSRLESTFQISAALPSSVRPQSITHQIGHSKFNKAAGYVKPMITQCCMNELYKSQKQGESQAKAVELAKTWERRFCNHKDSISGDRCIRQMIGERNKHRYCLAANSVELRNAIRHTVAGVPIAHVNDHKVMVMEPMSELTKKKCEEVEKEKLQAVSGRQSNVLGKRSSETNVGREGDIQEETNQQAVQDLKTRKKKAKGPNPLSMKKPKKDKAKDQPKKQAGPSQPKKQKPNVQASQTS